MRVADLKERIKDYKAARLRQLIVEMYKAMPKAVREGQGIDALVDNPEGGRRKPASENPDIDLLGMDLESFLDNAYRQYYFVPNRVVPKRERSRWRFTVLRLYKQLNQVATDPEHAGEAAALLERLYVLLCYGCKYVLFSSDDPFQSVGVGQPEFLQAVLRAKRQVQGPVEFVHDGLLLALGCGVDGNTLYTGLMEVFAGFLSTPDLKQLAIAACDATREDLRKNGLPCLHEGQWHNGSLEQYDVKRMLENLAMMGFICHMALFEYDEAVAYFRRHCAERDPETSLFVLLRAIEGYGLQDLWIQTYEEAVGRGVRPREEVRRAYDARSREASTAGAANAELVIQQGE